MATDDKPFDEPADEGDGDGDGDAGGEAEPEPGYIPSLATRLHRLLEAPSAEAPASTSASTAVAARAAAGEGTEKEGVAPAAAARSASLAFGSKSSSSSGTDDGAPVPAAAATAAAAAADGAVASGGEDVDVPDDLEEKAAVPVPVAAIPTAAAAADTTPRNNRPANRPRIRSGSLDFGSPSSSLSSSSSSSSSASSSSGGDAHADAAAAAADAAAAAVGDDAVGPAPEKDGVPDDEQAAAAAVAAAVAVSETAAAAVAAAAPSLDAPTNDDDDAASPVAASDEHEEEIPDELLVVEAGKKEDAIEEDEQATAAAGSAASLQAKKEDILNMVRVADDGAPTDDVTADEVSVDAKEELQPLEEQIQSKAVVDLQAAPTDEEEDEVAFDELMEDEEAPTDAGGGRRGGDTDTAATTDNIESESIGGAAGIDGDGESPARAHTSSSSEDAGSAPSSEREDAAAAAAAAAAPVPLVSAIPTDDEEVHHQSSEEQIEVAKDEEEVEVVVASNEKIEAEDDAAVAAVVESPAPTDEMAYDELIETEEEEEEDVAYDELMDEEAAAASGGGDRIGAASNGPAKADDAAGSGAGPAPRSSPFRPNRSIPNGRGSPNRGGTSPNRGGGGYVVQEVARLEEEVALSTGSPSTANSPTRNPSSQRPITDSRREEDSVLLAEAKRADAEARSRSRQKRREERRKSSSRGRSENASRGGDRPLWRSNGSAAVEPADTNARNTRNEKKKKGEGGMEQGKPAASSLSVTTGLEDQVLDTPSSAASGADGGEEQKNGALLAAPSATSTTDGSLLEEQVLDKADTSTFGGSQSTAATFDGSFADRLTLNPTKSGISAASSRSSMGRRPSGSSDVAAAAAIPAVDSMEASDLLQSQSEEAKKERAGSSDETATETSIRSRNGAAAALPSKSPRSSPARQRILASIVAKQSALGAKEAEARTAVGQLASAGFKPTSSSLSSAYDTRSILDHPPSPPTPPSKVDEEKAKEEQGGDTVEGNLNAVLQGVDLDDICADPPAILVDAGHVSSDDEVDTEAAAIQAKASASNGWTPFVADFSGNAEETLAVTADTNKDTSDDVSDNEGGKDGKQGSFDFDPFALNPAEVAEEAVPDVFGSFDPTPNEVAAKSGGAEVMFPSKAKLDRPEEEEQYREDDDELGANLLASTSSDVDGEEGVADEVSGLLTKDRAERIRQYNLRADGSSSSDDDSDENNSDSDDDGEAGKELCRAEEDEREREFQALDDDGSEESDEDATEVDIAVRGSAAQAASLISTNKEAAASLTPPPPPRGLPPVQTEDGTVTSCATGFSGVSSVVSSHIAGVQFLPDGSVAPGGDAASTGGDTFDRSVDTATVGTFNTLDTTTKDKTKTRAIPLIKPPPEAKMKAWAASKGLIPPASVASGTTAADSDEDAMTDIVSDVDTYGASLEAIEVARLSAERAIAEAEKNGPGEMGQVPPRSSPDPDLTPESKKITAQKDTEKETEEHRARLAAKFASASSAAAQAFEKRYSYEKTPHNSSDDLVVHASDIGPEQAPARATTPSLSMLCGTESSLLADSFACGSSSPSHAKATASTGSLLASALSSRQAGAFEIADLDTSASSGEAQRGLDLHGGAFNSWVKDYDSPTKGSKDDASEGGIEPEEVKAAEVAAAAALTHGIASTSAEPAVAANEVETNDNLIKKTENGEREDEQAMPMTPRKRSPAADSPEKTPGDTVKRRNARGSVAAPALKSSSFTPAVLFEESRNLIVPQKYPSPFETAVWNTPRIIIKTLSFLGDPAAVCRMKAVNRDCHRVILNNEHNVMKEAVRLGGLEMHLRPSFWMWVTLEKCERHGRHGGDASGDETAENIDLAELSRAGEEGRWHHTIMRDVTRSFGNMPPHKTGARIKKDSIVRALVFYGQGRLIKRGVKGGVDQYPRESRLPPSNPSTPGRRSIKHHADDDEDESIGSDQSPTDTVSDWGGISPVGSTISATNSKAEGDISMLNDSRLSIGPISQNHSMQSSANNSVEVEDIALCPRDLTNEVKEDLQNKLGFILHALAASNDKVGYCQGMDYIVAHLLRILQETVLYRAVKGTLPPIIESKLRKPRSSSPSSHASSIPPSPARAGTSPQGVVSALDIDESSLVVEETVYRVMYTMLTTYGLLHMYWPELRCLKTCCKVFERLIEIKLPVLADHFDHHGLNVGIFALGWFQTLFLYLPSMPTATVCHMWDIWLVERSFKIFFRVGTAILFLSQPILLNHELEGMMTYLNTFPDATLLNPDILIACALQIKVTNKMLEDIECEVTGQVPTAPTAAQDTAADKDAERKSTCSPFR